MDKNVNPFDVIASGFGAAAKAVGDAASAVGDAVGGAAVNVASAVGSAAGDVYSAFGGNVDVKDESTVVLEDGTYILPDPLLSEKEGNELIVLTDRYEKLNEPGFLVKAGNAVGDIIPAPIKDMAGSVGDGISEAELYKAAMDIIGQGFSAIEKQAASATVSPQYAVNQINRGKQQEKISSVEEICLLRSYDVARVVNSERGHHLGLAFAEGAATGVPGIAGVPFNLVLSTFLFFRTVQSVAMFYGYDVHADPSEMIIASEVLMAAYGAGSQGPNESVAAGYVGKVMALCEAAAVKQLAGKGWAAMAKHGGVALLIAQMRALAHAAAKKALVNAGKKGLEKSVFSTVFQQMGKYLTQSAIKGAVPIVGGVIGALFDSGIMSRMLDFAEVFYHKRFILEKETRIRALCEGVTFFEAMREETGIDTDEVIAEAEEIVDETGD